MRQDVFRRISMYLNIPKLLNSLVEAMPFHAVDRGSNPLGDARIRYNKGYQCAKHIGILSFFVSTGFPVVHVCPVASNAYKGISEGRFILQKRGILTDNKAVLLYFFVLRGIETFIFMKSNGSPKTF